MDPPSKPLPANQRAFEDALFAELVRRVRAAGILDDKASEIFERQYAAAIKGEPWGSGVGFQQDYDVPADVPRIGLYGAPLTNWALLHLGGFFLDGVVPAVGEECGTAEVPRPFRHYGIADAMYSIIDGALAGVDFHAYGDTWPTDQYRWHLPDGFPASATPERPK